MNLTEFLHMGGYAFYVWTSYGIAAVILVANLVAPMRQRKRLLGEVARRARRARRKV
jgi:heme exporter protein D